VFDVNASQFANVHYMVRPNWPSPSVHVGLTKVLQGFQFANIQYMVRRNWPSPGVHVGLTKVLQSFQFTNIHYMVRRNWPSLSVHVGLTKVLQGNCYCRGFLLRSVLCSSHAFAGFIRKSY
jgi:hypothetical protein